MLVQQGTGDWFYLRVELDGFQGDLSDNFQRKRILDRFLPGWSPRERPVAVHEYSANLRRIEIVKSLNNDVSGLPFVGGLDFLSSHGPGHRHFAVEIIGMRSAETGNPSAGLSECDCVARVSVHDRPNAFKRLEEATVCGRIG